MQKKNLNGIFINSPKNLGNDEVEGFLLVNGESQKIQGSKEEVARRIMDCVLE